MRQLALGCCFSQTTGDWTSGSRTIELNHDTRRLLMKKTSSQ